jgi:hypothetical protein
MKVVVIGGSDAGVAAALRVRELLQIVGPRSSEVAKRIDTAAVALHAGLAVDELNDLDLSYSPPLGSPWDPLQQAAQQWRLRAGDRR